ncbi:response regulator [Methanolobus halotolerans]|uniref:Two-component system response regulator n=1 Tax=Methanolobus halotolerans TaxID=2052935 RepID=A0A4E0PX16_9EURY|nr:response regulator [Methanolobus halotolerans]TGC09157.1 two-component system response regulator [Methanolobus halotolerans]
MKNILVVEDSPVNMELTVCLLEYDGYNVSKAMDGEQALLLLKKKDFSLILLDIQLPGMDGLELLRLIRNMERIKDIPVIALTANTMAGDKERFLAAGCNGYIAKPFDTHEFSEIVASFL